MNEKTARSLTLTGGPEEVTDLAPLMLAPRRYRSAIPGTFPPAKEWEALYVTGIRDGVVALFWAAVRVEDGSVFALMDAPKVDDVFSQKAHRAYPRFTYLTAQNRHYRPDWTWKA